ncbi:alpha/beta hydrolase family protein [Burkholderia gladioli]|uniref:alpha/beta hydrolase family protein n=1 Tax=Burkholderia gladioli TaxID=28095 RepID=UPI00163E66F6|nr:S9 family peptidase [Burkholderia gladioli]
MQRSPQRAARRHDVRDFFRRPERTGFQLSPDGRHLSFLARHEGRLNVFVQAIDERGRPLGQARALTHESQRDIGGYAWKNNDRVLFVKDFGGDENYHVLSVPIDGGEILDLTPFERVRAGIIDALIEDERHVLISHNQRDASVFDVFRVDVASGEATLIAENPGNILGWMTDHDSKLRVAVAGDGVNQTLLYREREDEPFRPVVTTHFRETLSPLMFSFDNRKLYVLSNRGRDRVAIYEFDPVTGEEGTLLFEHDKVDVKGMGYSYQRRVLTTIWYEEAKIGRHHLDSFTEQLYADLDARVPSGEASIAGSTRDETRMLVRNASDVSTGSVWLYDVASRELTELETLTPWLDAADMAPMRPIEYRSRDGLTIHGYLTLPVGYELDGGTLADADKLPLIVNPHGGPWARDHWGFNPEVQMLANHGYAVLQMNFRGSIGYGRAFWEASFGQWGRTMQNDIDDGVDWLVGQGIVDAKRIGIYGASYGGYATLAGVTFTPERYAAAIDYVGVSNLFTLLESMPPYWKPLLEMMYEQIGDPTTEAGRQQLHDASPLFFADRIVTPLFVAQGANDPRVKQAESDQIVEALRSRGIDVQYMLKANEGHGFANEENQYEFYEAMIAFLDTHLGGKRGA